jgi:hypothetical protein
MVLVFKIFEHLGKFRPAINDDIGTGQAQRYAIRMAVGRYVSIGLGPLLKPLVRESPGIISHCHFLPYW